LEHIQQNSAAGVQAFWATVGAASSSKNIGKIMNKSSSHLEKPISLLLDSKGADMLFSNTLGL
jgi:hypothetical protein